MCTEMSHGCEAPLTKMQFGLSIHSTTSGGSWNFSLGGQSFEELGVVRDSCGSHTQKWYWIALLPDSKIIRMMIFISVIQEAFLLKSASRITIIKG